MKKKMRIFIILLVIVTIVTILVLVISNIVKSAKNISNSTWLWNTSIIVDKKTVDEIEETVIKNNIKKIHLQIDYDLDFEFYRSFISRMRNINVDVSALEGAPEWAMANNKKYIDNLFEWLKNYNENALENEKLTEIHLDIEPYLLEEWDTNLNNIIVTYQDNIKYVKNKTQELNFEFGVDIPLWFDAIEYRNKHGEDNLASFIIKNIENVTIMAYRTKSEQIIDVVKNEVKYAKKNKSKLTVALELRPEESDNVSFYNFGKEKLIEEQKKVNLHYKLRGNNLNYAIHDLEILLEIQ